MSTKFHDNVVLSTSSAKTVSGNSNLFPVDQPGTEFIAVYVDVTAVSGTSPSCTFSLEWAIDGLSVSVADPAEPFTAITATGRKVKLFQVKGKQYRLLWTITGTSPSFTFSANACGIW